jgi:hypothetical protein
MAWYLGPALRHYRCHRVWTIKSWQERIVNQLVWFPTKPFPKLTSKDLLWATIEDLKVLLLNPSTDTYLGTLEQTQHGELIQLSNILHRHATTNTEHSKTKAPEGHDTPTLGVEPLPTLRRSPQTIQSREMYTLHLAAIV